MNKIETQIRHLIKTLDEQLYKADNATGLDRIQTITEASKLVADLEKLGVSIDKSFQSIWEGLLPA